MGGSYARAREHFARVVEAVRRPRRRRVRLAGDRRGPSPRRTREEFRELLEAAIAIDPDEEPSNRLLNLIAQRRARVLLDHIDDLFFEPFDELDEDVENQP